MEEWSETGREAAEDDVDVSNRLRLIGDTRIADEMRCTTLNDARRRMAAWLNTATEEQREAAAVAYLATWEKSR